MKTQQKSYGHESLFSDSNTDEKLTIKKLKLGPAICKLLGDLLPQGRPGQAPKPQSCRQEAYDFEVFILLPSSSYMSLMLHVFYQKPMWQEKGTKSYKDLRKPIVKSEPINAEAIPNTTNVWPPKANIVYPVSGEIKLKQQHAKLQSVVHGGIQEMTKYLLFTNAYPPVESHTSLVQQWLYTTAKSEKADAIKRHVKADTDFVWSLQDLVFSYFLFFLP
jgi:hypothetical protein